METSAASATSSPSATSSTDSSTLDQTSGNLSSTSSTSALGSTSLNSQPSISSASNQLDIDGASDQIANTLNQGQTHTALQMLETAQQGQPLVVSESLERMVAAKAENALAVEEALAPITGLRTTMNASQLDSLGRLHRAGAEEPRKPEMNELDTLPEHQQFDVYASMVMTRGDQAAVDALEDNQKVILGLRTETNTTANNGKGEFDDRVVVLHEDANNTKHVDVFDTVATEPSAQYDYRAGHDGRGNNTVRAPDTNYDEVVEKYRGNNRNIEGIDVNGDNIPDMGRMSQGSYEMVATTHPNPGAINDFSLRPSPDQLLAANAANGVERDSNGDGLFNSNDLNGQQDLNRTFKIHSSSSNNTDSAGCQTIHRDDYQTFIEAATGVTDPLDKNTPPLQSTWQYVLTNVQ